MLTYGELFAGAGGFGLGFDRAGMECRWQVEIDPYCLQVLNRHWPDVPKYSDVHDVGAHNLEPVDVISFGSPCQDLSVAGNRAGLQGERSGLFHEAARIIGELRPTYAVWENVPGALSSNGGRDFGAILDALADCGAVDICWRILDARFFGVPQRRRRLFVVASFRAGTSAIEVLVESESCGGHPAARREAWEDIAPTLDDGAQGVSVELPMIAASLSAGGHPGSNMPGRHHEDDDNLVAVNSVRAKWAKGSSGPAGDEVDNLLVADPISAHEGKTYTHEGKNNFRTHNVVEGGSMGVRRLTPRECERLQGWGDDHTKWTAEGKEIPDSVRYRLIGNGVASPCAEWIGHRLVVVDQMTATH